MSVTAWCDGACSNNGKANARAGFGVYFGEDDPRNLSERLDGDQTNQRAELMALYRAMGEVKDPGSTDLELVTDSMYATNIYNVWWDKWQANGKDYCHKELIDNIMERSKTFKSCRIRHVLRKFNKDADRLAKNAVDGSGPSKKKRKRCENLLRQAEHLAAEQVEQNDLEPPPLMRQDPVDMIERFLMRSYHAQGLLPETSDPASVARPEVSDTSA